MRAPLAILVPTRAESVGLGWLGWLGWLAELAAHLLFLLAYARWRGGGGWGSPGDGFWYTNFVYQVGFDVRYTNFVGRWNGAFLSTQTFRVVTWLRNLIRKRDTYLY